MSVASKKYFALRLASLAGSTSITIASALIAVLGICPFDVNAASHPPQLETDAGYFLPIIQFSSLSAAGLVRNCPRGDSVRLLLNDQMNFFCLESEMFLETPLKPRQRERL